MAQNYSNLSLIGAEEIGRTEGGIHPAVVVMILTFDGKNLLPRCLRSVLSSVYPNFRIMVLDNASTDGSAEFVKSKFPDIEVLRFNSNLGFSTAYNAAIDRVSEPYVLILNHDTEVANPQWIDEMVALMESDPDCAVVTSKIVFRQSPDILNSLGGMAYWWTGTVDIGFGERDTGDLPEYFEPFSGSGAAMLVRRDLFLKVGGFDDSFFMYCEDFDLGWRLRLLGFRTLLAPMATVLHDFSPGLGRFSPEKVYLVHRNYLRAMLKNYTLLSLARGLPHFALFTLIKSFGLGLHCRSFSIAWAPWRAIGWNILMLRDTFKHRRVVQKSRKVTDATILRKMGPTGFEPLTSIRRRLAATVEH